MKVELQCGDTIAIPNGCKAIIKDGSVVFEKEQKFKDGDILTCVDYLDYRCPFIYKGTDRNGFHKYYIGLDSLSRITLPNCTDAIWGNGTLHHATDEERQLLFDKMREQGLQWNAEEKRVEKIRWTPGVGETYHYVNFYAGVSETKNVNGHADEELKEVHNQFRTHEQAEEAAAAVRETLKKFHEENE